MADAEVLNGLKGKLAKARNAAEPIAKKGRNEAQKYDYVRAEDVIAEAERVLNDSGVLILPEILSYEDTPTQTRNNSPALLTKVQLEYTVIDTDSGEFFEKKWVGSGWDSPGDKALYKAITGGTKYFLASLLGIPFGDDPEESANGASGPEETISKQIAKKMVDRAWAIEGARDQLRLAASHVTESDVGDCATKAKATTALSKLTFSQAERVDNWISGKASD